METEKWKKFDPSWVEVSGYWVSAYLRPWSVAANWNIFLGEPWRQWLSAIASAPNPWLPALADERSGQPASIDFFLPWLPHFRAVWGEIGPVGIEEGVRVMRKATALQGARALSAPGAALANELAEDAADLSSPVPVSAETVAPRRTRRTASSGKRVADAQTEASPSSVKRVVGKGKPPAVQAAPRDASHAAEGVTKDSDPSASTKVN